MTSGSSLGVSDSVNKLKEKSPSSDEHEQFLLKRLRPTEEQQQLPIAKRCSSDDGQESKKNYPRRPTDGEQQVLLEFFRGCTHPNSTQLSELAEKLKWEVKRVRNWFQNKRTTSKALENLRKSKSLQIEMEKLRMENKSLKQKLNKHRSSCSPSVIPGSGKSVGEEQNCSPSAISGPEKSVGEEQNVLSRPISDTPFDHERKTNLSAHATGKLAAGPIIVFPEPSDTLPISSKPSDSDWRTNMFTGRTYTAGKLAAGPIDVFPESDRTSEKTISQPYFSLPFTQPTSSISSDFDRRTNMFSGRADIPEKLVAGPDIVFSESADTPRTNMRAGKAFSQPDMPFDSQQKANKFAGLGDTDEKLISCKLPNSVKSGDISAWSLTDGTITERVTDSARLVDSAVSSTEDSAWWDLAFSAIEELEKMAKVAEPLWIPNVEGGLEKLNYEHYLNGYARCFPTKKDEFVWEATRVTVQINIPSLAIVEALMDGEKWAEMFPGIICSTNTTKVISSGSGGTRHCALNLMQAEFQVVSPLVPLRCVNFLRFCKNINATKWAVVDVSVETNATAAEVSHTCRRLPSGCFVEKLSNGSSKVTWVEHTQYNKIYVHSLYRKLLRRGLGFGAPRWIAALLRHIQRPEINSGPTESLKENGRRSILKKASQMMGNFCAAVCGSSSRNWRLLSIEKDFRFMIRKSEPEEKKGMVICAATSIPLSEDHQSLFKRLLKSRGRWDFVTRGSTRKEKARILKGQDDTNSVTLFVVEHMNVGVLQETYTDHALAMVVCAPVEMAIVDQLMDGTEPAKVALLPYGFAVMPDSMGGSLLTVGFSLVENDQSLNKLAKDSLKTMNILLSQIIKDIQWTPDNCK